MARSLHGQRTMFDMKKLVAPGFIFAGGLATAHLCAASRFRRSIERSIKELGCGLDALVSPREDLPDAIAALVPRAAPLASRAPATVRLRQRGEMRFSPLGKWQSLTAEQTFAIRRPGFVWHAYCRVAPLLTAEVVDSYVGGEGRLEARLFGSIRVANAAGPETAKGELMRYLAELAWAPDAIRYNRALRWNELGAREFEVSADSIGGEARVCLALDENGDIAGMRADDRPRLEDGKIVPGKWFGAFSGYKELAGYRIPTQGEVGWHLEAGPFVYWRGEIMALDVNFGD